MENHKPYEEALKRKPDFRIKYRFYTQEEGGRYMLPYQGIRSDFWYEDVENIKGLIFMIWPEFENEQGDVILSKNSSVAQSGTARMWIINEDQIAYHKRKIKIGTKGFFKEGGKSTGECEVIELISLKE